MNAFCEDFSGLLRIFDRPALILGHINQNERTSYS